MRQTMAKVGFGGGCHWCTEAVFSHLKGVQKVLQGWISSSHPDAITYSEAVIVKYDPAIIPLDVLIEIHLMTHSASSNHSMRSKYRSAIYTFSSRMQSECESILQQKATLFDKPPVTKVYPFKRFKLNKEEYLDYYQKNREGAFCQRYITPKLHLLLEKYADYSR